MTNNKTQLSDDANRDISIYGHESKSLDIQWLVGCALVTIVTVLYRFWDLTLKPLHHDEGVNSYFLLTLFREGAYKYDPSNYHGPTLYYISLAFTKVFGMETFSIRANVAVFGVLMVILILFLKKYIGSIGSLAAGLFIGLSPGMVYISRYFIHEIFFVFCSLGVVLGVLFFIEGRKAGVAVIAAMTLILLVCFIPPFLNMAALVGDQNLYLLWALRILFFVIEAILVFFVMRMLVTWNDGKPIYLMLAAACLVLFFATKETAFITIGTMLISCLCLFHWRIMLLVEKPIPNWYYGGALIILALAAFINLAFFDNQTVWTILGLLAVVYTGSWLFGWVWRKYNPVENFAENKFRFFMAVSLAALIAAVSQYQRIKEGYKLLAKQFLDADSESHELVFYFIIGLIAAAALTWLIFLFFNREKTEHELAEPVELTFSNFREKLGADDNWEFTLLTGLIGAVTIFFVWLVVRFGVDLLMAWKVGKSLSAAWDELVLTGVDGGILAAAAVLLIMSAVVWFVRKPQKISIDFLILSTVVVIVFLYVGALFFSSFFTYPEGLKGAFTAYAFWTKTGNTDHTQNGFWAYVRWGMVLESPILILSVLGFLIALFKLRHRFALFAGFWAFGLFAAYTIIPYKTPWLGLSFILPMGIVAGYGINELFAGKNIGQKGLAVALTLLAAGILGYQAYDLNFQKYDSDTMPYVYAHTQRGFLDMIKQIDYYAEKSGKGTEATIEIVSPDYWPMPWYTRKYSHANYHGKIIPASTAEMIVVKKGEQDDDMTTNYANHYKLVGTYPLRPGVELMLLVRSDLADPGAKSIYPEMTDIPVVDITPEK